MILEAAYEPPQSFKKKAKIILMKKTHFIDEVQKHLELVKHINLVRVRNFDNS